MLRVALPNKGSLAVPASEMLAEAGYRQRRDRHELVFTDAENGAEFFFLRPRDIAVYVGSGTLDVGITGRDLLRDSGAPAEELLPLGFAFSRFRFAARPGTVEGEQSLRVLDGLRVATAYPGLVREALRAAGVAADVIRLDGAVETAIKLGVADVVADVVDTGNTLRQQGLEFVGEPLLESEAVLIRRAGTNGGRVDQLCRRLKGVLVARQYVMLAYDVREAELPQATALTPGIEAPTISRLQREDWVAVQAMVPRGDANSIMDQLYDVGARAIIVTDIRSCRL